MLQRWLIPSVIIMGISLIGGFATHEYLTKKNERREYRVLVDKKTEWLNEPELKSEEQQPIQIESQRTVQKTADRLVLKLRNGAHEYRIMTDKTSDWRVVPKLECLKNPKPKSEEQQPFQIKIKNGKPLIITPRRGWDLHQDMINKNTVFWPIKKKWRIDSESKSKVVQEA